MTETKHTYPSRYPPGTHWALDEAWAILDTIEPGVVPLAARAYLAGQITGALMRVKAEAEQSRSKPCP